MAEQWLAVAENRCMRLLNRKTACQGKLAPHTICSTLRTALIASQLALHGVRQAGEDIARPLRIAGPRRPRRRRRTASSSAVIGGRRRVANSESELCCG